ncbi:protein-disulfide reductase DsbD domain-containing protein [Chachezhania sediminis]|uniref:protein-disulfide reductase DsbD domain-containing protein n=1 Tax=Chachezhania sediminis TaxID=2599291 RepID=UPI00131B1F4D|nr:protein-disulfide reductase DsbD domain-containing protein [Chachezhania sediminis]
MTRIPSPFRTLRPLVLAAGLASAALLPQAARADSLDDLVRIEVLDGGQTRDGAYVGAIRLVLKDGWKTYWRAPGEAGIPPRFDWSGSRNLAGVEITWPTPKVIEQDGLTTIAYEHQMVLPIEIVPRHPGQPVVLRGRMEFGICSDVCIPGTLDFDRQIDGTSARNPAIAAAQADRPYSAREARVASATCTVRPTRNGLQLTAEIRMPSAGGREVAVIEPGDGPYWAAGTRTERQGDRLIASSEVVSENGALPMIDRSQVRITVLGQRHAVDIRGCSAG